MKRTHCLLLGCLMVLSSCATAPSESSANDTGYSQSQISAPVNTAPEQSSSDLSEAEETDKAQDFRPDEWLAAGVTVEETLVFESLPQLIWIDTNTILISDYRSNSTMLWDLSTSKKAEVGTQMNWIMQTMQEDGIWKFISYGSEEVYTYNQEQQTLESFSMPYEEGLSSAKAISPSLSKVAFSSREGLHVMDLATMESQLVIPWLVDHNSPDCPDIYPYPFFFTKDEKHLVFQMHTTGMGGPEGGGGGVINLETGEWHVWDIGGNTIQSWVPGSENTVFATLEEMHWPSNYQTNILYDIEKDAPSDLPFKTDQNGNFVYPRLDLAQPVFFLHTNQYSDGLEASDFGVHLYDIASSNTMPVMENSPEMLFVVALSPNRNKVAAYHHNAEDNVYTVYILALGNTFDAA